MHSLPYNLFLSTLIFAPLAFGSDETWSIALVEILVSISILCYFFQIQRKKQPFLHVPGIFPLLLLLLWIALQLVPLPPPLVAFLSPGTYQAYQPILGLQDNFSWIPLTVNQKATLLELLRLSSYALFYIFTIQLLSNIDTLTKTVKIVAWLTMGIAFLAIIQKFTSPHEIYWLKPMPESFRPTGPWEYHNHYAGFMELVFPLVLALFFYYRPKFTYKQTLRKQIVSIFSAPDANLHFFLSFGIILILVSVFVALSRGGNISISLGLFFFLLLLLRRKKTTPGKTVPLLILGSILLAATLFTWTPLLTKYGTSISETSGLLFDGRFLVWQDCIPLIKDFLFTGSGFGTFGHVYPQYNTLPATATFTHAHNDYIELITDGGLIGFSLMMWFVVSVLRNGLKRLATRRERYSVFLTIAGLTAIFSFLIHSGTDFNMHNGANGLYFFFLCGILVSAGNTRLHFHTRPTFLKSETTKIRFLFLSAIPLLLAVIFVQGGILNATYLHRQTASVDLNPETPLQTLETLLTTVQKAHKKDPHEGLYSYYRGKLHSYLKQDTPAFNSFLQASKKDPLEGKYLQQLGLILTTDDKDIASHLMAVGYARNRNSSDQLFTWVEWLLRHDRNQEALRVLQQGVKDLPDLSSKLPPLLLGSEFSREEISLILPKRTSAWIQIGAFADKLGQTENAEYYRLHALDFLEQEKTVQPWYFKQIYNFYKKQNKTAEAMAILRKGIEWLPEYANFHLYLGDYYQQQNIHYRAREEYKQALMLEPDNDIIQKRLETLY